MILLRFNRGALNRVAAIFVKEFIQLKRDKLTFAMVIMVPLIQLLLFGYTINSDIRYVSIGVVDQCQTQMSRQFIEDIKATQIIKVVKFFESPSQIMESVKAGKMSAGLFIPRDFEKRYNDKNDDPLAHLIVDGSDTAMAKALKALRGFPFNEECSISADEVPNTIAVELLYNPEQRSALFIVPGLLGVILTMTLTFFTAVALVRERERGNIEILIATPISSMELMVGKLIPYMVIGLIQVSLILLLGRLLFQLPFVGSFSLLYFCCTLFIFANVGLGLLVSVKAPNQLGAMQLSIFILLPSILLSGFMFPYDAMPFVAQWLAELLPMTHFIRLSRGIILRGAELGNLMSDVVFLFFFFLLTMLLSTILFKKKLD